MDVTRYSDESTVSDYSSVSDTPYSGTAHQYCKDVVSGKLLNSKWIRYAAKQHLANLSDSGSRWFFDSARVEACCGFIESLTLDNGKPFILSPWQVWIVASLIGWVDDDGLRKHREALILVPKGNGKSPLAAALGLWFAFLDAGPGMQAEVYTGATTLDQALQVHTFARQFVENQPAFEEIGVTALKRSIFNNAGCKFQPVIGKGKHGPRPRLFILDELHQAISDDLYGTAKTGCGKVVNSLLLVVSTAGVAAIQNPCYLLQDRAQKALEGTLEDDRLFAAIYCADDSVEWSSPEALRMANPNLGISNSREGLQIAIQEALRSPAQQSNVRAMYLNQWVTAASPWLNMTDWLACKDETFTEESVKHLPCYFGSDFAIKLDLNCNARLWRDDSGPKPHYYVKIRSYLPETQVNLPENGHYRGFVADEWLTATPGNSTDLTLVGDELIADFHTNNVREMAYDTRFAEETFQRVSQATGATTIPLAPSSATYSPPMLDLEVLIADKRIHHDGNPLLTWCLSSVTTSKRRMGDYNVPGKAVNENKIDAAVSLLLALNRARLAPAKPTRTPFKFNGLRSINV